MTILDYSFASRGHHVPERGLETRSSGTTNNTRRIYDLIAACGSDATTPAPGPNSFTSRFVKALQGVLDDENDGVLTTRLLAEVNKPRRNVAYLFDRLNQDDNRHIQLKALSKQTKQYARQLAANLGKQPEEEAVINLRLSLHTHQLSKQAIQRLADALVRACVGIVPLRRINWVNMEEVNPGDDFRRFVDQIHSHKLSPRCRFRKAIETVIDNNRSARIGYEAVAKIRAQQRIRKAIQHVIDKNRLAARESGIQRARHSRETNETVGKEKQLKETPVAGNNRPDAASRNSSKRARSSEASNAAPKRTAPARRLRSSARAEQSPKT